MIPGSNILPGEKLLSIVVRDLVVTEESVDPLAGGQNEQFDKEMPYDGYLEYSVVPDNGYIEMRTVFVDKNRRRRGAGEALFRALEEIAKRVGIARIVIRVECAENGDANPFCTFVPSMGYRRLPKTDTGFDWEKYV